MKHALFAGHGEWWGGHCSFEVAGQALAIEGGWSVDLVERAFSAGDSEQLTRLRAALRRLTVSVLNGSENPAITDDMGGLQTARDEDAIRRLALDYRQHIRNPDDFRNVVLYMDPEGGGGGHGDIRAILVLAEGLGIDWYLDVLAEYVNGSTRKYMALHDDGHWALVVLNVS